MIGHHITNICENDQHLHLTYSSERHIHLGGNTSYRSDGRLPCRMEHILLTVMEYFPTFIQAGTHPAHNDGRVLYSHPGRNTSCSQWWKISSLSFRLKPHPAHNDGRTLFFHPGWNHILITVMKDCHPRWNTSYSQWWNISALTFI